MDSYLLTNFAADGVLSNELVKFILIASAYILPYVLIPYAIKSLSGAFGNLAGMVNDRSRGLLDRNTKFRQDKRAEKMAAAKNFQRFNDRTAIGRGLNTVGGVLRNKPTNTYSKSQRATLRQSGMALQGEADLKNDQVWQANQNDDKFLLAVANRSLAKEKMAAALSEGKTAEAAGYQRALDAASQLQSSNKTSTKYTAAMALAKTGYQYSEGEDGYTELRQTMAQFAGGDSGVLGSMMNEAQFHLKGAGRFDLGGINNGSGYDPKAGVKKASLYQLANGKPESIQAMADVAGRGVPLNNDHAVLYKELDAMKSNATGGVRDKIVEEMAALEARGIATYMKQGAVDGSGIPLTTSKTEKYDSDRGDPSHHRYDPTYASSWSTAEKQAGMRTVVRPMTVEENAQKSARSYERPDPNNL